VPRVKEAHISVDESVVPQSCRPLHEPDAARDRWHVAHADVVLSPARAKHGSQPQKLSLHSPRVRAPRDDAPVVLFIHDKSITGNNEQDDADVL
jgi:hypothetical protein